MAVLTNPTDLARETLKLLAARRIAPTPENFTRYYHEIAGTQPVEAAAPTGGTGDRLVRAIFEAAIANPGAAGLQQLGRALEQQDVSQFSTALVALASGKQGGPRTEWGGLLRELVRQLELRQTGASLTRKREGLERVLINFGSDPLLFDKLQALVRTWAETTDTGGGRIEVAAADAAADSGPLAAL